MSQEYQSRYIRLVKEITTLQWVRESLPSHSKYYEGLKKKLEKQIHLKAFSERELKNYRLEKDHSSTIHQKKSLLFGGTTTTSSTTMGNKSYSNVIESVRFYENAIVQLQTQMDEAKMMMDELNIEKKKLDVLCNELHDLYNEIIIPDDQDSSCIFEQHLKRDVDQLAKDIPNIKEKITRYKLAQSKLYQARELIETAMKSLPGASTFMDRQAIASTSSHQSNNLFGKTIEVFSSSIEDPIKKANKIANQSYPLVQEASQICPDVPNIPHSSNTTSDNNLLILLTNYRGYRLKIESTLRTQVNPRLHGFENQLNMAKYQFEQKTIEWIDHQIITLEAFLRTNGLLINENLETEISRLRMGSRAAIAAVAEETTGRVTVDDVLEIATEDDGVLPEYQTDSSSSSSERNSSSSIGGGGTNAEDSILPTTTMTAAAAAMVCDSQGHLPSYALNNNSSEPPAYTR